MHGGAQSGQRLGRGVLTQHRLGRIATHHQGHGKDHEREQDQRQQRPPIRPAIIRKTRRSTMRYSPPAGDGRRFPPQWIMPHACSPSNIPDPVVKRGTPVCPHIPPNPHGHRVTQHPGMILRMPPYIRRIAPARHPCAAANAHRPV
jgi:hypothetical protein